MFLCRTGRVSAAALDQAFRSAGSCLVRLKANTLKEGTLTLRNSHSVHRCFCAPVRGVSSTPVRFGTDQHDSKHVQNWDTKSGFVITDWAHSDRVSAIAVSLSRRVQSGGGFSDIIRQPNRRCNSRGGPAGNALFTSNGRVPTGSMQTRSSSTAAATKKKSEADEEQAADGNKEEVKDLKDTSTISSSTAKAPEEPVPEPEQGKPTKAQQLKKVFKEYGAVGVIFHIGISLMSLGMFYLLISSGIDMAALLCKLGFSETVVQSKMAAGTSTFVLAYAVHKLFAPLRISMTLVSVPLIVRYFRKTGLFKPPTPAP